jgi:hypothetical protein
MLVAILKYIALALSPIIAFLSYRLFLHPLSRVPGPTLAAISSVWYAWHARNGRVRELGKTLHKQYGPVVRVSPNEVWFDSPEAFKVIYSEFDRCRQQDQLFLTRVADASNGFEKSDFYRACHYLILLMG